MRLLVLILISLTASALLAIGIRKFLNDRVHHFWNAVLVSLTASVLLAIGIREFFNYRVHRFWIAVIYLVIYFLLRWCGKKRAANQSPEPDGAR